MSPELFVEKMRGHLTAAGYEQECQLLRDMLLAAEKPHLIEFESAWHPAEL